MTGFGEGIAEGNGWVVTSRVKTTNSRYLDIRISGLEKHENMEILAQKLIGERFERGRVDVRVEIRSDQQAYIDSKLARHYLSLLEGLTEDLGLGERVRLEHLLEFDILKQKEVENLWPKVSASLEEAVLKAVEMRQREGRDLEASLKEILTDLKVSLEKIEEIAPQVKESFRERLKERAFALGIDIDERRLEEEVVIFAERSDILEEITRLKSHIDEAFSIIESERSAGRPLDFLAQEMNREVNTICSKAREERVIKIALGMKFQIERIREQVRNIE
jgi:uncharacterized protein (TIGR00255 family)